METLPDVGAASAEFTPLTDERHDGVIPAILRYCLRSSSGPET
jgi:hypothetical protein